jgi:hypothetical protein
MHVLWLRIYLVAVRIESMQLIPYNSSNSKTGQATLCTKKVSNQKALFSF